MGKLKHSFLCFFSVSVSIVYMCYRVFCIPLRLCSFPFNYYSLAGLLVCWYACLLACCLNSNWPRFGGKNMWITEVYVYVNSNQSLSCNDFFTVQFHTSNDEVTWREVNWFGLNWIESYWIESNWIGVKWCKVELSWVELSWFSVES